MGVISSMRQILRPAPARARRVDCAPELGVSSQWLRSLRGNKLLGSDGSVSGGKYGSAAGGGLVTISLPIHATGDKHKSFNFREIGNVRRGFLIQMALNDILTPDEKSYGQKWS
jgi:hypothetical protein